MSRNVRGRRVAASNKAGRVRLRPNRGFPRCLACESTHKQKRVGGSAYRTTRPKQTTPYCRAANAKGMGDIATWQGDATVAQDMWGEIAEQG